MHAFWIPCQVHKPAQKADNLAEWTEHESCTLGKTCPGRPTKIHAIFKPMQPRFSCSQSKLRIQSEAPIPQRVHDVIEPVSRWPTVRFRAHPDPFAFDVHPSDVMPRSRLDPGMCGNARSQHLAKLHRIDCDFGGVERCCNVIGVENRIPACLRPHARRGRQIYCEV